MKKLILSLLVIASITILASDAFARRPVVVVAPPRPVVVIRVVR